MNIMRIIDNNFNFNNLKFMYLNLNSLVKFYKNVQFIRIILAYKEEDVNV